MADNKVAADPACVDGPAGRPAFKTSAIAIVNVRALARLMAHPPLVAIRTA